MRFGPYEVVSELGRGGMGVVYRARSPDGRDVAVKCLLTVDRASSERFERERRLLDTGSVRDGPFLVMPFLPGGTLRDRLRKGALPLAEAVTLVAALARALGK